MNTKAITKFFLWLLGFAFYTLMIYRHHYFIGWCIFACLLIVRVSNPNSPRVSPRINYIGASIVIAYLALILIDSYYPFSPSVTIIGTRVFALLLMLFLFYAVYYEVKRYKAFKTTGPPGTDSDGV